MRRDKPDKRQNHRQRQAQNRAADAQPECAHNAETESDGRDASAHKAGRGYRSEGSRTVAAFKAAFPYTIPIFTGFWFLGFTYGIYMNAAGFSFWYPMLMSLTIFAGSVEFVTVNLLLGAFNPTQALLLTLMLNARHLFYGIAMLEKYGSAGRKRFYLIFGMCDESFSINYTAQIPAHVDKGLFMFFVTLLNQIYWVSGSTLGGIFGGLLPFDMRGIEFVMTAMFIVIFMEQWMKDKTHASHILGFALSLLCLILFGADNFIIPSMAAILVALTVLRKKLEFPDAPGEAQ